MRTSPRLHATRGEIHQGPDPGVHFKKYGGCAYAKKAS